MAHAARAFAKASARRPDPALQQLKDFGNGTVSGNDCFRPVLFRPVLRYPVLRYPASRYFDRILSPPPDPAKVPRVIVGAHLADFTTRSHVLFGAGRRLAGLNVQPFKAAGQFELPLPADARGLVAREDALGDDRAPPSQCTNSLSRRARADRRERR